MKLSIDFIKDSLVFNKERECFAIYELEPYNNSFLSDDKKIANFQNLQRLISQTGSSLQVLNLSIEESIYGIQEQSKSLVKGQLKELAFDYVDRQTDYLVEVHNGENEYDRKTYLVFKLSNDNEEVSINNFISDSKEFLKDLFNSTNKVLFDDYTRIDPKILKRYQSVENLLNSKISNRFKVRPLTVNEIGYIIEYINGMKGYAYNEYFYNPKVTENLDEVKMNRHEIASLYDVGISEHQRYLELVHETATSYVAYLTLSRVTGEMTFPDSQILFYQEEMFDYPIDTSLHIEPIPNKKALKTIRDKKIELNDLDDNANSSGNSTSNNFYDAMEDVNELESYLESSRDDMYKLSYLVRVSAESEEELKKRVAEVKDFYAGYNFRLQRPFGDQIGLHEEFFPCSSRYLNDYVQYVTSDFVASLGIGATHSLGDKLGFVVGYNLDTGRTVRIDPQAPAQNIPGSITSALAKAILGSLGGGKSVLENLMLTYTILFGGQGFVVDPKSERGNWSEHIPELAEHINVINLTSDSVNQGVLDPFIVFKDIEDKKALAIDVITFLTGISTRDSEQFPIVVESVGAIAETDGGMLQLIDMLKNNDDIIAKKIGSHLESFQGLSFAKLLFGDGNPINGIDTDSLLNIMQIEELTIPDADTDVKDYSTSEILSIGMMLVTNALELKFIRSNDSVFKVVTSEEAWATLQFPQGRITNRKMVREGRAKNSALDLVTQNADDLLDEKIKNNIGLKFAFRSTDKVEIQKTLEFFNLEYNDYNADRMRNLESGECFFQDIYGNVGILKIDVMFQELFDAFDTRPPIHEYE